eukprot:4341909-Pyramimonas_sp.AAC.1
MACRLTCQQSLGLPSGGSRESFHAESLNVHKSAKDKSETDGFNVLGTYLHKLPLIYIPGCHDVGSFG